MKSYQPQVGHSGWRAGPRGKSSPVCPIFFKPSRFRTLLKQTLDCVLDLYPGHPSCWNLISVVEEEIFKNAFVWQIVTTLAVGETVYSGDSNSIASIIFSPICQLGWSNWNGNSVLRLSDPNLLTHWPVLEAGNPHSESWHTKFEYEKVKTILRETEIGLGCRVERGLPPRDLAVKSYIGFHVPIKVADANDLGPDIAYRIRVYYLAEPLQWQIQSVTS